jgi:hypothetical protein
VWEAGNVTDLTAQVVGTANGSVFAAAAINADLIPEESRQPRKPTRPRGSRASRALGECEVSAHYFRRSCRRSSMYGSTRR